ncbi:peptidoglycan DD-metalloendopeptidase family protein [Candidatus Solirubrobacter pratensis]|uniref:peptidoglycan DD-metalloendopeptidase family protein n=1 Tax=Candidatus Solirubrobacter pratensis TaxID=1298857 RepID=UPI0003FAD737|nr:peptidoglycan DD-metalloendopeptidase family protein [Candidatus Solirubrobacter pratensis]
MKRWIATALLIAAWTAPPAVASERIAALQTGLRARGAYAGNVDGVPGPGTAQGVRVLQRRAGIAVDGIAGPATRRALGALGRHPVGSRPLAPGDRGFDVAALQFALESHGFPLGTVDGFYGAHTQAAVIRAQAYGGLPQDGIAGPATQALLRRAPALAPPLRRPILVAPADRYGPRGAGWHAGIDFPAATGTPVSAAASGRVVFSGYDDGYGLTVVLDHGDGVRTRYAHLSVAAVAPGAAVAAGRLVGRVGATGHATGPHLHFEVTVRGAATDPARALGL